MSRAALAVIAIVAVNGAPALRAQGSAAQPSVIVTQGDASVKRTPNQAWVLVAVEARAPRPADAQRQAAVAMTGVQTAVRNQGLAADAMKTTGYSLQPDMEYVAGSSRVKGYIARNQIEIRVDAIDKLGTIMDAAGSSGATSIAGVRFDIAEREAAEREALRMAVRAAMSRAEAMAAGAGRPLGAIVRLEEQVEPSITPRPYMTMSRAGAEAVPTPISPGEVEIKARVVLTIEIK